MKLNFSLRTRQKLIISEGITNAWMPDIRWELYSEVLNASLGEPNHLYATDQAGHLQRLRQLIRENDPDYVIRLAVHLRGQLYRKELSFILTAELAAPDGGERVSRHMGTILQTAGEIPEWLGYWALATAKRNGKMMKPGRALQKSLTEVFRRLDEYQFTRYSSELQEVMRATMLLVRPKAKDREQRILFDRILKDQLGARSTWQMELKALQEQQYDSIALKQAMLRDKWKEGISSFRMGYPALLATLRPILAAGVSGKVLKLAGDYIGNAAAIARTRQLPFPLLEAYRELRPMPQGGTNLLLEALEEAAVHSARNIAGFEEDTRVVIAMDVSNSMKYPVSEGSKMQRYDIGPLLALLLKKKCRSVLMGIFGNGWKPVGLSGKNILAGVEEFRYREGEAGYGTNGHLVIQDLLKNRRVVDKVMIFTDCRLWDRRQFHQPAGADLGNLWRQYKQLAPGARLYLFDLAGSGDEPLQMLKDQVTLVAGWSEGIFDVLAAAEKAGETIKQLGGGQVA